MRHIIIYNTVTLYAASVVYKLTHSPNTCSVTTHQACSPHIFFSLNNKFIRILIFGIFQVYVRTIFANGLYFVLFKECPGL